MSNVEGGGGPIDLPPPPPLKASCNYFFFEASRVNKNIKQTYNFVTSNVKSSKR